jgi:hypothetical protein
MPTGIDSSAYILAAPPPNCAKSAAAPSAAAISYYGSDGTGFGLIS